MAAPRLVRPLRMLRPMGEALEAVAQIIAAAAVRRLNERREREAKK
jgi:hypothetical protein